MGFSHAAIRSGLNAMMGASLSVPASFHVALYTVLPNSSGVGGVEPGGNYSRITVANNLTTWAAAADVTAVPTKKNAIAFTFPTIATSNWGTIVGWGLYDDSATPTIWAWGQLATPQVTSVGQTPTFVIGSFGIAALPFTA